MLTSGKSTLYVNAPVYTHTHTTLTRERNCLVFLRSHCVEQKYTPLFLALLIATVGVDSSKRYAEEYTKFFADHQIK